MTSMQGTHKARAKEWALGHSSNGNEQVAVLFEITQGSHAGKSITWFGYFTEAATDRTLDALRYCGWEGDDFVNLVGLDTNEVEIVIEPDTYEGKTRDRVKWINRPTRLALREQMTPQSQAAFAVRMRAKAIAHKQTHAQGRAAPSSAPRAAPAPEEPPIDDIPF